MTEFDAVIAQMDDAINRDDIDEVTSLLASGIDPNLRDAGGDYFLTSAAWIGSPQLVRILLEAGADPTLKGGDGLTPLERLLQNTEYWDVGHDEVRRLLENWGK
jgi:ankyrin repeat protein